MREGGSMEETLPLVEARGWVVQHPLWLPTAATPVAAGPGLASGLLALA